MNEPDVSEANGKARRAAQPSLARAQPEVLELCFSSANFPSRRLLLSSLFYYLHIYFINRGKFADGFTAVGEIR